MHNPNNDTYILIKDNYLPIKESHYHKRKDIVTRDRRNKISVYYLLVSVLPKFTHKIDKEYTKIKRKCAIVVIIIKLKNSAKSTNKLNMVIKRDAKNKRNPPRSKVPRKATTKLMSTNLDKSDTPMNEANSKEK